MVVLQYKKKQSSGEKGNEGASVKAEGERDRGKEKREGRTA